MSKDDQQAARVFLPDLCTARSVLVVVVVAELLALVMTLAASHYDGFSFERLALSSLFIQWVALTSAALLCALRDVLNRMALGWAAFWVVALVVLDTFIFTILARLAVGWMLGLDSLLLEVAPHEPLVNAGIAAIIAGMVMRYFFVQEQLRDKGEAELQARIQALQSRIRPHFLFNSMNIIASLISVDPEAAEQVVEDLSRLFRASLKESGNQVTLREELDLCERYARIEQLRIGERLQLEWDIRVAKENVLIPLLTLQPLVENAIYHGIQPLAEGGVVRISAWQQDGMVYLAVANPCGAASISHQGNRMAQANIRHRLEALYGKSARLETLASNNNYEVRIIYPLVDDTGRRGRVQGEQHAGTGM